MEEKVIVYTPDINEDTSLIRTVFSCPKVSGIERFHCTYEHSGHCGGTCEL